MRIQSVQSAKSAANPAVLLCPSFETLNQHLDFIHRSCECTITTRTIVAATDHVERLLVRSGKGQCRCGAWHRNQAQGFSFRAHYLDTKPAAVVDAALGVDGQSIDSAFRICEQPGVLDTAIRLN